MIIVFDELEAIGHQLLFQSVEVIAAKYPTAGSYTCKIKSKSQAAILCPLSGFDGADQISDDALALFHRDFRVVVDQLNAEIIDFRLYLDESGEWPYQLRDYLMGHAIEARIVKPIEPLRKVICHYLRVAGYASAALRDGRVACDFVRIIGYVGVSKVQLRDPRFVFANSEGIVWIEGDGSFDQNIFHCPERKQPERWDVSEILNEMAEPACSSSGKNPDPTNSLQCSPIK